jgi:tRNA pseudouridine55 synthase
LSSENVESCRTGALASEEISNQITPKMPRPAHPPPLDGALVVNKPPAATSHDGVEAVRRLAGFRQIGHLGTLDPLATGVLVLLLGRATRLAQFYKARRKRYTCAIYFGYATDTYDADGQPASEDSHPQLSSKVLENLAAEFTGRIMQTPPSFSAKKIHGTPAHELARKKKPVHLEPVEVEVFEFRLLSVEGQLARFSIESGSGTYVRSLAHDMGQKLGCGAHIREITRTAVGEFTLDQAVTLQELAESTQAGSFASHIVLLENLLLDLPSLTVLPVIERRIRHGAKFNVSVQQIHPGQSTTAQGAPAELNSGDRPPLRLRIFNQQHHLIAIAQAVVPRTYQPVLVLEPAP